MNERKELVGNGLEFAGLIFVFLTVFWQSNFSDWWKDQLIEWQSRIQEELILTMHYSIANLAALETEQDQKKRHELAQKISEVSVKAVENAIIERNKRTKEIDSGQAAFTMNINTWLAVLGAFLFLLGKYFTLSAVADRLKKE